MTRSQAVRRWRWAAAAGVVLLVAFAVWPRSTPVEVVRLQTGPMRVTVDEEGRTQVKRRYVISAPLAGRLLRIGLEPGDAVAEGDTLARVVPADAPLLDPRDRAELQARVRAAEAAAAQASALVARAGVAEATARDDLARKQRLVRSGSISARELAVAEGEASLRAQDLAGTRFAARAADHQLASARAALGSGRAVPHEEVPVLAPASGRVLRVVRDSEGIVAAGTALLELGDPEALEIRADLLTVDAVRVRAGMPAVIDHWGGATALAARVRTVEPSGFTKASALGVDEQRVRVVLDLVDPPPRWRALGDGFRVEVHVEVWRADSALRVPATALFRRGDHWAALIVEGDRVRERRVEVGEQSVEQAEVRAGAEAGALVVLHPGEALRDGMRVKPLLAQEAAAAGRSAP